MFKYLVIIGVQISLCIYYINTWRSVHNSLSISLFGYVKIYIIYNLILTSFNIYIYNIYTPIKHRGWEPTDTSDPNQSTAADLHCLQPGDLSSDCQCKDDIAGKNLRETPPIDGRITGIMGFQHLPAYLTVSVSAIRLLLRAIPCGFLLKPKQLKGLDQTGSWQSTLVESSIMDESMDKRTEGRDGWISCIRRATKLYFCPNKPALGQSQQLGSLPPPLIVRSNHQGIPALNKELLLQNATEYSTMCNDTILRNRTCSTDLVIICYDKSSLTRPTCLDSKSQTVG